MKVLNLDPYKFQILSKNLAVLLTSNIHNLGDNIDDADHDRSTLVPIRGGVYHLSIHDELGNKIKGLHIPQSVIEPIIQDNNKDTTLFVEWYVSLLAAQDRDAEAHRISNAVSVLLRYEKQYIDSLFGIKDNKRRLSAIKELQTTGTLK